MRTLLIIDPQNDFCEAEGTLCVPNAANDMNRLGKVIKDNLTAFDKIIVTLDSHHDWDIAHPVFWQNSAGENAPVFSAITHEDVKNGVWRPTDDSLRDHALEYTKHLEERGRPTLTIWPPHCIVGTWGHGIQPGIKQALGMWEKTNRCNVHYYFKGLNPLTEHYSAIEAEWVDPEDSETNTNMKLVEDLAEGGTENIVIITGEAGSHCVKWTVLDLINQYRSLNKADELLPNFRVMTNWMSPVPGFEEDQKNFFEMASENGALVLHDLQSLELDKA